MSPSLDRSYPMKSGKSFGKAIRTLITVFQSQIDYPDIRLQQPLPAKDSRLLRIYSPNV